MITYYIYIYIYSFWTNNFVTFANNCEDANCFPQRKALLLKVGALIGVITQFNICYPLDLALEQGVLLAQEMQLARVLFECDATNVINTVNDSATGTPFGHIIQDIIKAQSSFYFCSFRHLNRAFNFAAHELASFASRNGSFQIWRDVTPPFLDAIVNADLQLYLSYSAGSSNL